MKILLSSATTALCLVFSGCETMPSNGGSVDPTPPPAPAQTNNEFGWDTVAGYAAYIAKFFVR